MEFIEELIAIIKVIALLVLVICILFLVLLKIVKIIKKIAATLRKSAQASILKPNRSTIKTAKFYE